MSDGTVHRLELIKLKPNQLDGSCIMNPKNFLSETKCKLHNVNVNLADTADTNVSLNNYNIGQASICINSLCYHQGQGHGVRSVALFMLIPFITIHIVSENNGYGKCTTICIFS